MPTVGDLQDIAGKDRQIRLVRRSFTVGKDRLMRKKRHESHWKVNLESVYRADRIERLQKMFELLDPEKIRSTHGQQKGEFRNEQNSCDLCKSVE